MSRRCRAKVAPLAAPLAAVMLLCAPLAGLPRAARAADPVRVITHTLEYCLELSARARALGAAGRPPETAPAQAEASQLVIEADRLCAQGQIRPGIIRLRRAIMLLRGQSWPEQGGR